MKTDDYKSFNFRKNSKVNYCLDPLQDHKTFIEHLSFEYLDYDEVALQEAIKRKDELSGYDVRLFSEYGEMKVGYPFFKLVDM
jgi:hypothetical protein